LIASRQQPSDAGGEGDAPTGTEPLFEWGLLENAIDYLREAVRRLEGDVDRQDLKYAILSLGAGLELLLTERLRREDWRLLFSDLSSAEEAVYRSGDFHSVGVWKTMNRLEEVAGIEISEVQRSYVVNLREQRNPLEHFRIRQTREAVSAAASAALGFALDFVARHLDEDSMSAELQGELEEIREALPALEEFVSHRLHEVEGRIEDGDTVLTCPRCFQDTAIASDGISCLFCGFAIGIDDVERAAEDWIGSVLGISEYQAVKEGGELPLYECPNCEQRALVDRGLSGDLHDEDRWLCFACGARWSDAGINQCALCGEPFDPESGAGSVCRNCFAATVAD
jgi:rubrerythrin